LKEGLTVSVNAMTLRMGVVIGKEFQSCSRDR
jgi:hypothetical protein